MEKRESMHTPGPWQQGRYGPESFEVQGEHRTLAIVRPVFSDAVTLANARLIAAAPELLAACERALAFVESMPDNDNVGLADCLRAAIAKAEGREP